MRRKHDYKLQEVTIRMTLPEERYSVSGAAQEIEIKAYGPSLPSAILHGIDALFEGPAIRQKKPGVIDFRVTTAYSNGIEISHLPEKLLGQREEQTLLRPRARFQRGHLILRGKRRKVWVGRWREDVVVDGRLRRLARKEILGTLAEYPTKGLARRALDLRLEPVNKVSYRPFAIMTFATLATKWKELVLLELKPSSQVAFRSHLNKWLLPYFGQCHLHEIGTEQVQRFIVNLPLHPKSVKNVIGTFRLLWKAARTWHYIDQNIFDGIRFPRGRPSAARYFSMEEMKRIIAAAEEPYRTMYWLIAETGLRAGELFGLAVDDINLDLGVLRVRQSVWAGKIQLPKTPKAIRHFLLSPQLVSHLKDYLATWNSNELRLLFSTRAGTPIDPKNILQSHLHPLLEKLEVSKAGFHAFRHGNSSVMDQLNTPLKVRQDRLGHADPGFTLRQYTHSFSEDDRALALKLGTSLDPDPSPKKPS